jgi:hypothetical protein
MMKTINSPTYESKKTGRYILIFSFPNIRMYYLKYFKAIFGSEWE